jgi:hypothetical protein
MKHLDPYRREQEGKKPRHLAAMIAYIFRWELFVTCESQVGKADFSFDVCDLWCGRAGGSCRNSTDSTVSVKLSCADGRYLQADGQGQAMHPLFWIVILFLGKPYLEPT